jgi:hypothetical protein
MEVCMLSILCRCYVCVYVFVLIIVHVVACAGVIVACGEKRVWAEHNSRTSSIHLSFL